MPTAYELTPAAQAQPFEGCHYSLNDGKDIISWINKDLPKNLRALLPLAIGLAFLVPVVLMLSWLLWRDYRLSLVATATQSAGLAVPLLIALVCWTVTAFIAYQLLQLSWKERVTIDNETILHTCEGFLAPKPRSIEIGDIWKVSFERYKRNQGSESTYSCNIVHKDREQIGRWMRPNETLQLYRIVGTCLQRREVAALIQFIENDERHPGLRNMSKR